VINHAGLPLTKKKSKPLTYIFDCEMRHTKQKETQLAGRSINEQEEEPAKIDHQIIGKRKIGKHHIQRQRIKGNTN
jgi:hypothetical protein